VSRAAITAAPADATAPGWAAAAIEWALVASLGAWFIASGLVPAWRRLGSDFPNYYLGARLYLDGYPLERLYDLIWIHRQKDHAGLDQPFVNYAPLTLFSALLVAPMAGLPALQAKRIWLGVSLLLLLGTGILLRRMTRLGARRVALVILLAVLPLRTNFLFGQQYVLLLFLVTLAAWMYFSERKLGAGGVLAAAFALKLTPALLALMFVRKRQWRPLIGLGAGSLALGALALALFGWEPLRAYAFEVLPRAVLRGELNDPYSVHMSSLPVLLRRLFVYEPELNPHPVAHLPALFAALRSLSGAAILVGGLALVTPRPTSAAKEKLDWATFIAVIMFLASTSSSYHFCLLILAAALGAEALLEAGRRRAALAPLIALAAVSLPYHSRVPAEPDGWAALASVPRLYATAAFCLVLVWAQRALARDASLGAHPTDRVRLALAFVVLTVSGAVSDLRHFAGQFSGYTRRLRSPAPTLMAAEPAVAGADVYLSRMGGQGYVVDRADRPLAAVVPAGVDLFHPTVSPNVAEGWLEVAGRTSRIARFERDASDLVAARLPVDVEDGEQPVISSDGRLLAFLRPRRGRSGLWVVERDGPSWSVPREIVDADRDVLELAFFPDDRIAFSAWRRGGSRLFVTDPRGTAPVEIGLSQHDVRYPAVSPDGRWIAYAQKDGANWQLWVAPLPAGQPRRLTDADCNSVSPAWRADARRLVYATDCGRGLGHTALAWIDAVPEGEPR
jgi:hypothetical protein